MLFLSVCRNVVFPFVFFLLAIRFSICFSCFCWQLWSLSVFHFGFCEVFFWYLFTLFLNVKFWCNLLYSPFLDKTKKGKKRKLQIQKLFIKLNSQSLFKRTKIRISNIVLSKKYYFHFKLTFY